MVAHHAHPADMLPAPDYTRADITAFIDTVNCCAANYAFSLADKEQAGLETCNCEFEKAMYLQSAMEVMQDYIPPGAIADPGRRSIVALLAETQGPVSTSTFRINGVLVYSSPFIYSNVGDLLQDFIDNAGLEDWTFVQYASGDFFVFKMYAPTIPTTDVVDSNYYNGIEVIITYFDETEKVTITYEQAMFGGQYIRSAEDNCLTNTQVQAIMAAATQVCGCRECQQNTDTLPQPGSSFVIVQTGIIKIVITAANFVGGSYQSGVLVGKTRLNFSVFSNDGSGVELVYGSDYTLDAEPSLTGTVTFDAGPGNYVLYVGYVAG